jgi:hypothetical protein
MKAFAALNRALDDSTSLAKRAAPGLFALAPRRRGLGGLLFWQANPATGAEQAA